MSHVHWTIKSYNLSLKVVFQSFMVLTEYECRIFLPNLQRCPNLVFSNTKMFNSHNSHTGYFAINPQVTYIENPQSKKESLKEKSLLSHS